MSPRIARSLFMLLTLVGATTGATCRADADLTNTLFTTEDIRTFAETDDLYGRRFDLTGQIITLMPLKKALLQDATGGFEVHLEDKFRLQPGDRVSVSGRIRPSANTGVPLLEVESASVTGSTPPPPPEQTTIAAVATDRKPFRLVSLRGTVTDAFADEIDTGWNYFILRDGTDMAYAALPNANGMRSRLSQIEDAEVEIVGVSLPHRAGLRAFIGLVIVMTDESNLRILKPAPTDPFTLPELEDLRRVRPEKITAMSRRTAEGDVIAVWHGGRFLLRERYGRIIRVELADPVRTPKCGQHVKVVGHPETDLYRINLARALFREENGASRPDPQPMRVTPADILRNDANEQAIQPRYHGLLVSLRGEVCALPATAGVERRFYLQSAGFLVPVDVSARPDIARRLCVGCTADVTGVCVLDSPNWHPNLVFPHIEGLFLVPRSETDIRIVSNPPWWTARRLMILVGALLTLLASILVWNLILRKLVESRGRELCQAEISTVGAMLRVDERTRLAVELHDSLAQNLTGVSLQIAASQKARATLPDVADVHLATACRMLASCRTELRRCLWDLRNEALDEKDFAKAVRLTVQPVLGKASLQLDFNVSRTCISDTTAHAILQIVRELVSNAVCHGHATDVSIGGGIADGVIRLTVMDDGLGFDPERCPGPSEGHFGIKGIRERVKRLVGSVTVDSAVGSGTRVEIAIPLPPDERQCTTIQTDSSDEKD